MQKQQPDAVPLLRTYDTPQTQAEKAIYTLAGYSLLGGLALLAALAAALAG